MLSLIQLAGEWLSASVAVILVMFLALVAVTAIFAYVFSRQVRGGGHGRRRLG